MANCKWRLVASRRRQHRDDAIGDARPRRLPLGRRFGFASRRTPSQWLVGCFFWTLRFAACSIGANLNQTSFSWRSAGIWAFRFRTATSKSLLAERGPRADHVTVWRWVQRYAPGLERRLRRHLKPTNDSWRVDEMYVRVKGKWVYLYRAVDSSGATIDFLLSAKRAAATAQRFLTKALGGENHPEPRVINSDKHAAYPPAIAVLQASGHLADNCQHHPVQFLNASQHFRCSGVGGAPSPVTKRFI